MQVGWELQDNQDLEYLFFLFLLNTSTGRNK